MTDFGVSYIDVGTSLTCNLSSGTKQYMAPEIFTKTHEHGAAADFWALAVVIFEVMFGKRPFHKHVNVEFTQYLEKLDEPGSPIGVSDVADLT